MAKRKISFLFLFLLPLVLLMAQTENRQKFFNGFSGGMMLHSGYLFGGQSTVYSETGTLLGTHNMEGMPFGIGGCLRFHLGKHLRVGMEGYVSTLNYATTKSYFSLGWGGILADGYWVFNKWTVFAGGTIGGGRVKNVTLLESTPLDFIAENGSSYREYGVLLATPFAGIEYALTKKLHLFVKADWIFNITHDQPDFAHGVRCYVGLIFQHLYQKS